MAKIYTQLPEVLQTEANKNFFETTVEQLFSPANVEVITGFLGKQSSTDYSSNGSYLREATATRHHYGLTPAVNTINTTTGVSENFVFYDELVDTMTIAGVNTRNHNRIFSSEYQSFLPPIDVDKFVNYQEYYWSNNDLPSIVVTGTASNPIDIDKEILGVANYTSPNGVVFKNGMVINFSGQYVIPASKTSLEYYVEGVGESIVLVVKNQNIGSPYAVAILNSWDNTNFTSSDANVKYTAGNISSVIISDAGIGYINPTIVFTGSNTSIATATATANSLGAITSITVTGAGANYSGDIGLVLSSTPIVTNINTTDTYVDFYDNVTSAIPTPYKELGINSLTNVKIGQLATVDGQKSIVTGTASNSIKSITNVTNAFQTNRTSGVYTVSGTSDGSGTGQSFRVSVIGETELLSIHTINDSYATWSSNATIKNARTSVTKQAVASTSSGSGTGATFKVVYDNFTGNEPHVTVTLVSSGTGYRKNDTITITGSSIDSVGGPDITFNVYEIVQPQGITAVSGIALSNSSVTGTHIVNMSNLGHIGNISTSGNGTDAVFEIVADGSGGATVTILDGGIDFADSETITINDVLLGSNNAGTLTFNVSDVITFGDTSIELLDGGTGHAVGDTITIADSTLGNGGASSLSFDISKEIDLVSLGTPVTLDATSTSIIEFIGQGADFQIRTSMFELQANASGTFITGLSSMALSGVDPVTGDYYLGGAPDTNINLGWDLDSDGDGDGDAVWGGKTAQESPDYNVLQRGSANRNIWSRINFWHHRQNFLDAGATVPDKKYQATRPIIEFDKDIELYNFGTRFIGEISLVSRQLTKAEVVGLVSGTLIDDAPLSVGATVIFPNDEKEVSQYVYKVSHISGLIALSRVGDINLNPTGIEDGETGFVPITLTQGDQVNIKGGLFGYGKEYYWNNNKLELCQVKQKLHQEPLMKMYDDKGQDLSDMSLFPNTSFKGNKIFNYKIGTGTNDLVLGFPLTYKPFKSTSEIDFENFLGTEVVSSGITTSVQVAGYYYYKLLKATPKFHSYWKNSKNKFEQSIKTFYYVNAFDVTNAYNKFFIGCVPKVNTLNASGYDINILVNGDVRTDFAYTTTGLIEFTTYNFSKDDIIEIEAVSDNNGLINEKSISKYQLPLSWGHNAGNEDITSVSEPEYLQHFTNLIKNQDGFTGEALGNNNFKDTTRDSKYATDIVKVEEDLRLGSFLLDDQPHNLLKSLRFCEQEYTRYKGRLKSELTKYYTDFDTTGFTSSFILEKVLRNVVTLSVGNNVFQQSYVIPFGDNYIEEIITINKVSTTAYNLSTYTDLSKIENSLLVYKERDNVITLLEVDKDYTLSNTSSVITLTMASDYNNQLGDTLTVKIYDKERDSAELPPTPSAMGLYPLYVPEIIVDNTFSTPISVLIGHDGSKTTLFNDSRDNVILEFEKRIYNSAKKEFRSANSLPVLNYADVKSGYFRPDNFNQNEWFDLLRNSFAGWTLSNGVDYITNDIYSSTDEFTWNYRGTGNLPGHWRGWFEYHYDTVRPHTDPWEMLGFTEKPSWWDSQYITVKYTDYGSNNTPMWEDLEQGIIKQGPRENVTSNLYKEIATNPFRRMGLLSLLPVTSTATLKSPHDISSTGTTTLTKTYTNATIDNSLGYVTTSFLLTDGISIGYDVSNVYVTGKSIPNFADTKIDTTLSTVKHTNGSYNIPRVNLISVANDSGSFGSNAVGVLVNGLPLHNIKDTTGWNAGNVWHYNNEFANRNNDYIAETDSTGVVKTYTPTVDMSTTTTWGNTTTHSGIVGWAFDGLPIYGPYGYSDPLDNTSDIVNIKSSFQLKTGIRASGPGGDHTGMFVEDYTYNSALSSQNGYAGRWNNRVGVTPDSAGAQIKYYVCTIDDAGTPMFPYAVGGGANDDTTNHTALTYGSKYFGTGQQLSLNTLGTGYTSPSATPAITSAYSEAQSTTTAINGAWRFGDGAPVENAWKYSESYPFAITQALLLSKPGMFATVFADPTRLITPVLNKKVLIDKVTRKSWDFKSTSNFTVHGTKDQDGNFLTNIGYTQFIKSYLNFQGLDITTDFYDKMKSLNVKLGHRMAGFIDKDTATIRTDQYSTTGTSTSLIIPDENIKLDLHSSPYKSRNSYSGVVVEKTTAGYKVRGFDKNVTYFNILESDLTGASQSITRGGDPVAYANWSSSIAYPQNSIVKYIDLYYQAINNIDADVGFITSNWTQLASLPTTGGAIGVVYTTSTGLTKRVDYDTEYTTVQGVFDFLVSLGRYHSSLGFSFGLYDASINAVRDWNYSAEQFLFWITGGWEVGNTLELSPMSTSVSFAKPNEFVSEVKVSDNGQFSLLDQDGTSISPQNCAIVREGNSIKITPPTGKQIYSAVLYTKQTEHALIVDNVTDFADTIYNTLYNQKQDRLFIKAKRTLGWEGRLSSEGFIISGEELQPNLDNITSTMGNYHNLGFIPVDKAVYTASRGLFGFEERQYLTDLDILDDQQVEFYKGMVQNKGTLSGIGKLAKSNSIVQGNVTVFDEWALKVGEFGDIDNNQSIELALAKKDFVQDPQLFQLEFPEDTTGFIKEIIVTENKSFYDTVPEIEISLPTGTNSKQATATVKLTNGIISSIEVTEGGAGYNELATVQTIAGNINVTGSDTKFNSVTISSADLIPTANIGGIGNITIIDHFASNVSAQNIDLSSATEMVNVATLINNNAVTNANIVAQAVNSFNADSWTFSNTTSSGNLIAVSTPTTVPTTLEVDMPIVFSGTGLGGISTGTTYYVKAINVTQPANLTQFYTTFTVSATVGGTALALSDATGTMYGAGGNSSIIQISGNDFTLGGSALANLNLATTRNQPKQRYAIDIANNTTIDNIIVSVSGNVITQSGNWEYDAGDRWKFSTASNVPSGSYSQAINIIGINNSSTELDANNIVQIDGEYPYVDVYVDTIKLENANGVAVYNITNATTINFPDVTLLPNGDITTGSNVTIVERATIDFTDSFQGDVPGATLNIKAQSQDGLAIKVEGKRLYTITDDIKNDEIITIDIDDSTRFLKKPTGIKTSVLWPKTNSVDHTGMTDASYRSIPNAGYVRRQDVNYQAYAVQDIQDLFATDRLYKPSKDELIHVASSENNDWNVYRLREIENGDISFVEQTTIDTTSYLYTTEDMFNYVDSNQIQQTDLSRFVDYTLVLKKATVSDNLVIWTNQEVVDKKSAIIKNFGAISMIQANASNIAPLNTYDIVDIEKTSGFVVYGNVTASSGAIATCHYTNGSVTPVNGDYVQFIDLDPVDTVYTATSLVHGNMSLAANATYYDSKITITTSTANVASLISNVTPISVSFTGSDLDADTTAESVQALGFIAQNVDYASGTFDIHTGDGDFQSYFGNPSFSNVTTVTGNITNVSFTATTTSNVNQQVQQISNVNVLTSTFTIPQSNIDAIAGNVMMSFQNKCVLVSNTVVRNGSLDSGNVITDFQPVYAGDIIKVFTQNIRGYYTVESSYIKSTAEGSEGNASYKYYHVINAPWSANIATTGSFVDRGVVIDCSEEHQIDSQYAGKRVLVHNASNPYYNQSYKVNRIPSNTSIEVSTLFAYEPGITNISRSTTGTVDGNVVDAKTVTLTTDNTSIKPFMIVTATGVTERVRVASVNNNVITLDKKVTIDNGVTVTFQKMSIMTTLDHDVVKLNNTSFRVDDISSVTGIADSINRTQAIKKGFIQSDTMWLDFPMITKYVNKLGNKAWDYAGMTPYVDNLELYDMTNMLKTGTLKVDPNKTVEDFQKGSVLTNTLPFAGNVGTDNSTYNNPVTNPIDMNLDPAVEAVNIAQNNNTNTVAIDMMTVDPKSNLKGTDANPVLGNKQTAVLNGKLLADAPTKRCGPDACAKVPFRGIPSDDPSIGKKTCFSGVNIPNGSTYVTGTGHGDRKWTSKWSGYYTPREQVGGNEGNGGFNKLGIMGAKTWSDNGSTKSMTMRFTPNVAGSLFIHAFQTGKKLYNTTKIQVTGGALVGSGTVAGHYIGKSGAMPSGASSSVVEVEFDGNQEVVITGTTKGGGNHWHSIEFHISGKRNSMDTCSEVISKNSTVDDDNTTGGLNGIDQDDMTAYFYNQIDMVTGARDTHHYQTMGSGLSTLLFDNFGAPDGILIYQGMDKGATQTLLAQSSVDNLRILTPQEKIFLHKSGKVATSKAKTGPAQGRHNSGGTSSGGGGGRGQTKYTGGLAPTHNGTYIGVKNAGAMDFDIDKTKGSYITIIVTKNGNSSIYDHCIMLPKGQPVIDDPSADPNPIIDCSQSGNIPEGANSSTTSQQTGPDTVVITQSGTPTTKRQGGGGGNSGHRGGAGQTYANWQGFTRPFMTGSSFVPSIFRKTVKTVFQPSYGVPISLASGRYVNNQVQLISGNYIVPLAQRMKGIIPITAPLLKTLDAQTLPYYNVLDANRSAFEKNGMFYNFDPKRINTDVKLNDGGIISVTGGELYGLEVSDTFLYGDPYNGTTVTSTVDDYVPYDTTPPEDVTEGPIDTNTNFNDNNWFITIQPCDHDGNGVGTEVPVPIYRPTPGITIDIGNVNITTGDNLFINGQEIAFNGTGKDGILHAFNCTNTTGFDVTQLGEDKVRISSCTNAPLTVKEGCAGGIYKEVLDFHIVRSFISTEISNTSVIPATTGYGNVSPTAVYTHYDVDGGVIGNTTPSTTEFGSVLSSKNVQTGGSGYAVGDRMRLVGGTPIEDPFSGIADICVDNPGAGYSAPENVVVRIGDGSTPGRNASVKTILFDANNGIKKIVIDSPGEEYDINRPPTVTIMDIGTTPSPVAWGANTAYTKNQIVSLTDNFIASVTNVNAADSGRTAGEYQINLHTSGDGKIGGAITVTIDDNGAATIGNFGRYKTFGYSIGDTVTLPVILLEGIEMGGTTPITFDVQFVGLNKTNYYTVTNDFTSGLKFNTNENVKPRNNIFTKRSATAKATVDSNGKIPRVAKFEITSVDPIGGITSVRILDRGIYKVFPTDLTNGLPLEYDHINLGDEAGLTAGGQYTSGSGLGQFDPLTLDELGSPGGYDPINNLLLGGSGAKIFLTSREIPDCSQQGNAKGALGLPDLINDINPVDEIVAAIQAALQNYGYSPDVLYAENMPINDAVSRIRIGSPQYPGIIINGTPGLLDRLGIPPGTYNVASLCIQAVIETQDGSEDNPEALAQLTGLADELGLGVSKEGPIDVIKLLCVDTIGDPAFGQVPGDSNSGMAGQDPNSIFGDGSVTFAKDLFQYELRSLTGAPVRLRSGSSSQEVDVLYMESQRYATETDITNANVIYSAIPSAIADFGNVWIDNYNNTGWNYLEKGTSVTGQEELVDTKFLNNALIYDNEDGNKRLDLHLWDPFKGILPGFIDKEIEFVSENDPVVYDSARNRFDKKHVGKVWWDISTLRYNWYEQGTARDRWLNWGSTFPGSTIALYEWVQSSNIPTNYNGSGTPRSANEYLESQEINPKTGKYQPVYYYWVRNKDTLSNQVRTELGRDLTTYTVAKYLADPVNYGLNLISFVKDNAFTLTNVSGTVRDEDDNLQINFSKNLNPDGKKHVSWQLARENDNNSNIPEDLGQKLIDSLCGYDEIGNMVPDGTLSKVQRYGIKFRPRQTMFKNVKEARRLLISMLNKEFKLLKMNTEFANWDITLPTNRTYIETKNWYAVKSIDPVTQEYTYYDESYKPIYKVSSVSELYTLSSTINDGTIIQVKGNSTERYKLYMYNGSTNSFTLISIEKEIVQLKASVHTDDNNSILNSELRTILKIVSLDTFKDQVLWNKLFFGLLKHAYVEQGQLDWAFKTSYLYVEKEETDLIQFNGFRPENFNKVLEYMNEVKPYTSKIREYKDGKSAPIEFINNQMISDFDRPAYVDRAQGIVRILDEDSNTDVALMANIATHKKYAGLADKSADPVRKIKETIVFDRTHFEPKQFEYNPTTETANISIAKNIAWLKSNSNADVSANTYIRSVDRIIKYDPAVITRFNSEMDDYLVSQSYVSGEFANVTVVGNATIMLNAIESGYLDDTLSLIKSKASGNFLGELLDANVFTKVVDNYDGTTDYQQFYSYDTDGFDVTTLDLDVEVINYEGTFNEELVTFRRNDTTYSGFDNVTFGRMLYGEGRPEELVAISPLENFIITVTTNAHLQGNTSLAQASANASTVIYRTHLDLSGDTDHFRVLSANTTTLQSNITSASQSITVADASVLPKPLTNTPGVVWVESERIEYTERNTDTNILSSITRGTKGTTSQNWTITDSATINVYNGATEHEFTSIAGTPASNVWLDVGATSLADIGNIDLGNSTIMKFIHNR